MMMHIGKRRRQLTITQEFSIEIPDKEADAIHSGTTWRRFVWKWT